MRHGAGSHASRRVVPLLADTACGTHVLAGTVYRSQIPPVIVYTGAARGSPYSNPFAPMVVQPVSISEKASHRAPCRRNSQRQTCGGAQPPIGPRRQPRLPPWRAPGPAGYQQPVDQSPCPGLRLRTCPRMMLQAHCFGLMVIATCPRPQQPHSCAAAVGTTAGADSARPCSARAPTSQVRRGRLQIPC